MEKIYEIKDSKSSVLERFGLYYLNFFRKTDSDLSVFNYSDIELTKKVNRITLKGMILSALIGIVCVFPAIWVDIKLADKKFLTHYGWLALVTITTIIIELYVLFIIALKAVYEVSEIINLNATENELEQDGVFSVKNILARTALELPDPELKILGIDPFKRISKKNLFVLGLLYKAKILVTNLLMKNVLLFVAGKQILGVHILYSAIPVEIFWNCVVIKRVVLEARLRLFGFALANRIAQNVKAEGILLNLSPMAQQGCIRAIGNAVVMGQNYHPNMILLLLRFQQILQINGSDKYDDWDTFLVTLKTVNQKERYFLLDLFTVAAAFDSKLSKLEIENIRSAYGDEFDLYYPRLLLLTQHLKNGQLNASLALCKLDLEAG